MIERAGIDTGIRMRAHSLHIEGRELLSVTGVRDVDMFNEEEIRLVTDVGELNIEGSGLHLTKLDLDSGQVMVEGSITALEYTDGAEQRGSVFSRLFK